MAETERLILFDIDGTLLYAGKGARMSMKQAIEEVIEEPIKVEKGDFAGKTDPMIVSNHLIRSGCLHEELTFLMNMVNQKYLVLLKKNYKPFDDGYIYNGIMDIIDKLSEDPYMYFGLMTGNLEEGARIKLEPYGLNDYLPVGAFGNDGFMRIDLPPVALRRCEIFYDLKFEKENIIVVGDTPDDVSCGKYLGAKTIAIARNPKLLPIIKATKPNYIFNNTENVEEVVKAIYE